MLSGKGEVVQGVGPQGLAALAFGAVGKDDQ